MMHSKFQYVALVIALTPAVALAPDPCKGSVWECTANGCASGATTTQCQSDVVDSEIGGFKVEEWEDKPTTCSSWTNTQSGSCDEPPHGWRVISECDPGGGNCCLGYGPPTSTTGATLTLPKVTTPCIQPGGQG